MVYELIAESDWGAFAERFQLSPREAQIARCLIDGATERSIASELSLSEHTVHTYVGRIYRKGGVGNRHALTISVFALCRRALLPVGASP